MIEKQGETFLPPRHQNTNIQFSIPVRPGYDIEEKKW
jgi:hypothetical protein